MQLWRRQAAIFGLAFALVLAGGVALAAVSSMSPSSSDGAGLVADGYEEYEKPEEPQEPEGDHDKDTTTTTFWEEEPEGDHDGDKEGDGEGDHEEDGKEEPKDKEEEPKEEEDTTPPAFEITSPADGTRFKEKVVTFSGYVEPGSTVTRGKYSATVDGDHWEIALVLSPGKNIVGFVATDAAGNKSDDSVTLYYDPPKEEKPDEVEWSAKQKYGSCGENPPYDVFYGTATPGTKIFVESPFGGGSTTADSKGKWRIKVHFYEVPPGGSFEVVVESNKGHRKVFGFTYTGGGGEH